MVRMESLAHVQDNMTVLAFLICIFLCYVLGNCVLISFNGFSEINPVC